MRTLLLSLVIACLLPGVIGATGLIYFEYRERQAQQQEDTLQTARALVQAVDSHLLKTQAVAQTLAQSEALGRHDFGSFHRQAQELMVQAGFGTNVVLRDAAGRQLLNTLVKFGQPLPSQLAPEQVGRVFATGKPTISDLFVGPFLKRPIMSVDVPVFADGKVIYDLGIGILPDQFNAILENQKLPGSWVAAILDSSGTIAGRTHSPEQYVGQRVVPELLKLITTSSEGLAETVTKEGIPVATSFSRSSLTKWGVVIGIPSEIQAVALWQILSILAAGVFALFGIGLALALIIGNRIAHSVKALITPAIALGRGDSAPRPRVHIKEAAAVAAALGRAADLLTERAAALSARDAELLETHRLAKFGTWNWDLVTGEIDTSASVRDIYGRDIPPFPEQRGTLLTVESWEQVNAAAQRALRSGQGYNLELEVIHGDGHTIWINALCQAVRNDKGEVVSLRGAIHDITERKLAEQRVREISLHDALTGLPNRAFVFEYGSHLVAAAQRSHGRGALLFIDLDRFKPINDLYGHETGDRVLQEVGKRLRACTRHEDLVGRLGGDEFVIILPSLDVDRHRAAVVAQHMIDSISQPVLVGTLELSISPSIGIAYFPAHAANIGALIHAADLAMYQAKQLGRANYQFYTPELERQAGQTLSLEVRLKRALKHDGLILHYQPIIDVQSGKLVGAEALVRLLDSDGDADGPASFIPVAESVGLIGNLGEWVAIEACRQHELWHRRGLDITIAINVSPLQFRQRGFAEELSRIIVDSGIDPKCLVIEVTESTVMESVDEAIEILRKIKSLGVRVALDDFGTGYSSLSSLSSLPLDKLKIDQSFVQRTEHDPASRVVTEAIIALGHSLKLEVVAEGIESEHTLGYLREHGCNQAQGYWFSQPLVESSFAQWCQTHGAGNAVTTLH